MHPDERPLIIQEQIMQAERAKEDQTKTGQEAGNSIPVGPRNASQSHMPENRAMPPPFSQYSPRAQSPSPRQKAESGSRF